MINTNTPQLPKTSYINREGEWVTPSRINRDGEWTPELRIGRDGEWTADRDRRDWGVG